MPATAKQILDRYLAFMGQTSEVSEREIAVEMLEQFMASDRESPAMAEARAQERFRVAREPDRESPQVNGHGAE